jgi:hypothetical protein
MYSLFAENFRKATGLNINVNDILCSCKSDEERKKLYDKFSWMMQRGARLNNASSKPAKEYASAMNSLVETVNLSEEEIAAKPELKQVFDIIDSNSATPDYLAEFMSIMENGGEITLDTDIILKESYINVKGEVILNLNGHNITAKNRPTPSGESSNVFVVHPTGVLTINGNGKVISERSNQGIPVWAYGGSVILNGGEYYASSPSGDLIYTSKANSSIIINGGKYVAPLRDESVPGTLNKRCAVNILDAVRDNVTVEVRGGEFLDFNPADNASEGPNTNFVPEGYVSETVDNIWWRVRKTIVIPDVPSAPSVPETPEVPEDNSVYLTWENGNEMLEDTLGKNIIIK